MATIPHHVSATIRYYQPKADGNPPDVDDLAIIFAAKDMDSREVVITDIRGKEDDYQLDKNGFQVVQHVSSVDDFADENTIKSAYYPEMEELILKSTGASKLVIFNHIVRSGPSVVLRETVDFSGPAGPAPRVHIDQTPKGAEQLLFRELPHDVATEIASHRWQIINAWRPLKTIQKDPLAIADSTTIPESDLVALKRIYPVDKEGENCAVKVGDNSQHKWYYVNQQRPDEVLLFKQHESDPKVKARGAPHSSFTYPGTEHLANRQSIELRAIVWY